MGARSQMIPLTQHHIFLPFMFVAARGRLLVGGVRAARTDSLEFRPVAAFAGDLALIRMMSDGHLPVDQRRGYKHAGDALLQIVRADGVLGCWRGCTPTVVRAMALNAAQLAGYSQAKEGIISLGLLRDGFVCHFAASLFAGFIATVVSIPVDMVKTR